MVPSSLLALLLYLVTLRNGFVLDDSVLILKDRHGSLGASFQLHKSELVVRYWSVLIDSVIWKTNLLGFHLTNALLHAVTARCSVPPRASLRSRRATNAQVAHP